MKTYLKTSSATDWTSLGKLSSGFLPFCEKKISYFVDSKSPADFGGYLRGRPLPRFGRPTNNSGCFVFLWLFNAGWLRNDLPQSHPKILPFNSCLERRLLSIKINILLIIIYYIYLYLFHFEAFENHFEIYSEFGEYFAVLKHIDLKNLHSYNLLIDPQKWYGGEKILIVD